MTIERSTPVAEIGEKNSMEAKTETPAAPL